MLGCSDECVKIESDIQQSMCYLLMANLKTLEKRGGAGISSKRNFGHGHITRTLCLVVSACADGSVYERGV